MAVSKSQLDEPLKISSAITLANRIALAPMTNTQSNVDGSLHDDEFQWIKRRAPHFGLISTCAAYVSDEGKAWEGQLGISEDRFIPELNKLATMIRSKGAVSMVQIHHAGNKASLAPQKISAVRKGDVKGATYDDIQRIIKDFVDAAIRADKAGFNGVEVHGANGYLFTQFLAPKDNSREDEYGGDISGRSRLLRETVQAIKKMTSPNFMVNVRISPVDLYDQRGLLLDDSIQLGKWLAEDGVNILHLSLRQASGIAPYELHKPIVVKAFREQLPDTIKIEVAGGIWSREDAIAAENAGADIVALGKAAIVHPDWNVASQRANFQPYLPPWDIEYLRSVAVSQKFVNYLLKFPGLLIGGAPPRK